MMVLMDRKSTEVKVTMVKMEEGFAQLEISALQTLQGVPLLFDLSVNLSRRQSYHSYFAA